MPNPIASIILTVKTVLFPQDWDKVVMLFVTLLLNISLEILANAITSRKKKHSMQMKKCSLFMGDMNAHVDNHNE